MKSRSLSRLAAATFALVALTAANAYAHAMLVSESPAANSTGPSPTTIALHFSHPVEAKFSTVELKTSGGVKQSVSAAVDPKDRKSLLATVPAPLAAGKYNLAWKIVATDGHRMQGSYAFTVR